MEEKTVEKVEATIEETEDLEKLSEEINIVTYSTGDPEGCSGPSSSSSRGESAPQPYKQSIADMEEEQQPTITIKELKALKRSRYDKIAEKFQYAYVLKNKRTGLVVEIRAASSVHACNIIGWKPRHAKLIEVIDKNKKEKAAKSENTEVIDEIEILEKV